MTGDNLNWLKNTGIVSSVSGWLFILASIQHNPWFVFIEHAFSDLGGPRAFNAWVFNYGMMFTGVLIVGYSIYLLSTSFNKSTTVGAAFMMITGVFLTLIGAFPSGTQHHYFVSVWVFTQADLSILAWGIGLIGSYQDSLGKAFMGLGIIGPIMSYVIPWPSTAAVEAFGILIMNVWVILVYLFPHE